MVPHRVEGPTRPTLRAAVARVASRTRARSPRNPLISRVMSSRPTAQRKQTHRLANSRDAPGIAEASAQGRGSTIVLPTTYTQLLGLRGREAYLDPQILAARDKLAAVTLEGGYSPRVTHGYSELLKEASTWLLQNRGRTSLEPRAIVVDWDMLPGALALLQQVNDDDLVIELGTKMVGSSTAKSFKRDVLLSMALAHCGLASEAFSAKAQGRVSVGCAQMEEALQLLQDGGSPPLAPVLAAEIQEALEELKPAYVLDQLQELPLDVEHMAARKEALTALKAQLHNPQLVARKDGSMPLDPVYVQQALWALTTEEACGLLDWEAVLRDPGGIPWVDGDVLNSAILANVAMGFTRRQPSYIRLAEKGLRRLQKDSDVLAAHVASKVLLGLLDSAHALLMEAERNRASGTAGSQMKRAAGPSSHREVLEYVRRFSPASDADMLPGLVAFTELWLSRVALPAFRDTRDSPPSASLVEYFDDRGVTSYLALHGERDEGLLAAAAGVVVDAAAWLRRVVHHPLSASLLKGRVPEEARQKHAGPPTAPRSIVTSVFASLRHPAATYLLVLSLLGIGLLSVTDGLPRPVHKRAPRFGGAVASIGRRVGRWLHTDAGLSVLDLGTAERLLLRWQAAKAAALGPRRNKVLLQEVLTEPLLPLVMAQATKAEEAGWFWNYKLDHVKVETIDPADMSAGSPAAVVTAKLGEKADLWGENGKQVDSYASTYRVEYKLVQRPNGSWRIADALVLG